MNNLQVFKNTEFGEVRVIEKDGEPWFVGKDVAKSLGYSNTKDAIINHVDETDRGILKRSEVTTIENHIPKDAFPANFVDGNIPNRGVTIINESGLYSLILSSKLPTAKKFKHWVTAEVLPSIHKHGAYMTPEKFEEVILNPDTMIKLCTALKEEQDKNKALQAANSALTVDKQIMQPKADYFDELVDRNLLTSFRETAKELGVKQNDFIKFLLDKKYIYRDKKGKIMPYASKNDGLFEIKETYNEKTKWSGTQTLVTPKGRETFRLLCV